MSCEWGWAICNTSKNNSSLGSWRLNTFFSELAKSNHDNEPLGGAILVRLQDEVGPGRVRRSWHAPCPVRPHLEARYRPLQQVRKTCKFHLTFFFVVTTIFGSKCGRNKNHELVDDDRFMGPVPGLRYCLEVHQSTLKNLLVYCAIPWLNSTSRYSPWLWIDQNHPCLQF